MATWKRVIVSGDSASLLNFAGTGILSGSGAVTAVSDTTTIDLTLTSGTISGVVASGSIDTAQLTNGGVTAAKLATGAVTSGAVAAGNIVTAALADAAVTDIKIASSSVQTGHIVNSAVTTAKINDGAITTAKLGSGSVGTGNINDGSVTNAKLTNSSVTVGSTAISLGASATTIAGLTSVTSTTFVGALTGNASTATSASAATYSVSASRAVSSVTAETAALATAATNATSASYANLTNVNGDITITAAGTATIANSAVTNAKIADGSVSSAKLAAGAIINAAVAANAAIAYTKLDFAGSNFVSASAITSPSQGTLRVNGSDIDLGLQTNDSPTFTNLTVSGDLTVNGTTTTLNTTNVLVEDRFMFLASGSAGTPEGGIIVETNSNGTGTALFYDGQSTQRWALTQSGSSQSATSLTPHGYISVVAIDSGSTNYQQNGNIFVDGQGLIYIYS